MTIDERLERLAERHEALTPTVEILAAIHRGNEQRFARSEERFTRYEERFARNEERLGQAIAAIVETHEQPGRW
jgi:hypothetical protein